MRRPHSVRTAAGRPAALMPWRRALSASARVANGPTRTRMRLPAVGLGDLGVGLQAELLDLLPRLARGLGVGEGADLHDEAAAASARGVGRLAFEQRLARGRRRRRGACRRRRRCGGVAARGAASRLGRRARALRSRAARRRRRRGALGADAAAAAAAPAALVLGDASAPAARLRGARPARAGAAAAAAWQRRRRCRGAESRSGCRPAIGRGWVSNSSGKPITPISTSTAAPISRWRARRARLLRRRRPAAARRLVGIALRLRNDSRPMRCVPGCERCSGPAISRRVGSRDAGRPSFSTPPTV